MGLICIGRHQIAILLRYSWQPIYEIDFQQRVIKLTSTGAIQSMQETIYPQYGFVIEFELTESHRVLGPNLMLHSRTFLLIRKLVQIPMTAFP